MAARADRRACGIGKAGSLEEELAAFFWWADHWAVISHGKEGDPDAAVGPFILWEYQREIVREIFRLERLGQEEKRTKVLELVKSRDLGVTAVVLLVVFWQWAFRRAEVLLSSRVGSEVDQKGNPDALLQKLQLQWQWQPLHIAPRARGILGLLQNLDSGAAIAGQKATEATGRGNRKRFVFIDEYMALPQRVQRGIIKSTATTANLVILVGQPGQGAHGKAFELFEALPRDQVMQLDWRVRPDRAGREVEDKYATHDDRGNLTYFGMQLAEHGGSYTLAEAQRELACRWDVTVEGAVWSWRREKVVYTDDDPEFRALGPDARVRLPLLTSWDFGIGSTYGTVGLVSLLEVRWLRHEVCAGKGCKSCKAGMVPAGLRIWVDREKVWTKTAAPTVGDEAVRILAEEYSRYEERPTGGFRLRGGVGQVLHKGDPAGEQTDPAGKSWRKYMAAHIPGFQCLDSAWNAPEVRASGVDDVQFMLDKAPGWGSIRVHESCRILLAAMQQWRWNVPEGVQPGEVESVRPEKSQWSHPADAEVYGAQAAQEWYARLRRSMGSGAAEVLTKGKGAVKGIEKLRMDYRRAMGGR